MQETMGVSQVRPWVRFWARLIDLYLFGVFAGLVLDSISPDILDSNGFLLNLLALFLWIFIKPFAFSRIGDNPGEMAKKIKITKLAKNLLS